MVILGESQQHPFPIPILTCEIIAKKEMWGGTSATEYKGWMAALNQLVFLPIAYYLEVFAREVKLYQFVCDPDLGKIDITYTNYSFMHLEPIGLQSALLDLSNAIVKGMFEYLHYFLTAMGVQKDLHEQGKRINNSKGDGQDGSFCLNCFHYSDWDTIVNLFQYQNEASKCHQIHNHQAYLMQQAVVVLLVVVLRVVVAGIVAKVAKAQLYQVEEVIMD